MKHFLRLILQLLAGLTTVLGSRGTRAALAENLLLKRQLLVLRRSRRRAPNLRPTDRLLFGLCSLFLSRRRLLRAAILLRPSTLLRFHRRLKQFQYRWLYSSRPKNKPGPIGPAPDLIQAICDLVHQGLDGDTPDEKAGSPCLKQARLERYAWRSHCHGLFDLPIAA